MATDKMNLTTADEHNTDTSIDNGHGTDTVVYNEHNTDTAFYDGDGTDTVVYDGDGTDTVVYDEKGTARKIAHDLLAIGAVFLRPGDPFTWASGIRSPIYCDNRLTLTAPDVRSHLEHALAALIRKYYPGTQLLMGTATAGIAHAAVTAHIMGLPMGYVRAGNKDHGRQNRIEGRLDPGARTVVVEDLISTGGSCIETAGALRDAGADVLGIASIFTYGLQTGVERLEGAGLVSHSLTDFDTVCETALAEGRISPEDLERLRRFRNNPRDESWMKE